MTTPTPNHQHIAVAEITRWLGKWNGVDVEIKHFDAKDERVYVEVAGGVPGYEIIVHPANITNLVAV